MPQRIVALEISDAELRATVLQTTFRDYRVEGFYSQARDADGGGRNDEARRFLDEHLKPGDTVLSALPGDRVSWRTFFLPFRDQKRLGQTVPFEVESNVPFGLDEIVVDFLPLHRDRSGTLVLAALVQKTDLENHLELLQGAGADPKVVGLGPVAALNTLGLINELPPTFAFLDLGAQWISVALYRDQSLAGLRTLSRVPVTAERSNGAGPEGNEGDGAPVAESLIRDLRWTFLALNGASLDEGLPCYLAGDPTTIAALDERLKNELLLDTRRLDQLRLRNLESETSAEAAKFSSTLGMALREVAPAGTLGLNFRRGEFMFHRSQLEMRRALRGVAALAAIVVALTVADLYVEYRQLAERANAIDRQIQKVFSAAGLEASGIGDPVAQLQSEIELLRERTALVNDVVPISLTSVDFLHAISAAVPNKVRIDVEDYNMDPDSVRLRGNTDTFESVDAIKHRLLDTRVFSDVQVKDAKAAKKGEGVDFRMTLFLDKGILEREAPQ